MIGIIDYGMGNLKSVYNALGFIGAQPRLIHSGDELQEASHMIIPGVGAFAQAMENLKARGLEEPIRAFMQSGRPVLGICLGMQLLATLGHEPTTSEGLNIIPGEVRKFQNLAERIPHIGWNSIELQRDHYLFEGVKKGVDFYFVHSYYFDAVDNNDVLAICDYGIRFAGVVARNNVTGMQFHPEKSQKNGLKILENFCFNEQYA
ncbi:imidazole glycerol phosphate synthase subunit HisH [Chitinophaga lutea]